MGYDTYIDFTQHIRQGLLQLTMSQKLEILALVVQTLQDTSENSHKQIDDNFLNLTFDDDRSAEEIIHDIESARINSERFGEANVLFD